MGLIVFFFLNYLLFLISIFNLCTLNIYRLHDIFSLVFNLSLLKKKNKYALIYFHALH